MNDNFKRDWDTPEQVDAFDIYLKETSDMFERHTHKPDAFKHSDEEWESFCAGWNAAKKHFSINQ